MCGFATYSMLFIGASLALQRLQTPVAKLCSLASVCVFVSLLFTAVGLDAIISPYDNPPWFSDIPVIFGTLTGIGNIAFVSGFLLFVKKEGDYFMPLLCTLTICSHLSEIVLLIMGLTDALVIATFITTLLNACFISGCAFLFLDFLVQRLDWESPWQDLVFRFGLFKFVGFWLIQLFLVVGVFLLLLDGSSNLTRTLPIVRQLALVIGLDILTRTQLGETKRHGMDWMSLLFDVHRSPVNEQSDQLTVFEIQ
ncbi:hypothetical protein EDD86DRAFT_201281 [Gorgonomyces haynaldii]|nr:hypothetical protein EDD86DRAFT_201281 [Gorgonomyces haynaldii]